MIKEENEMITIIIPYYNSKEYIDRCIESLMNQTYTNFEIILIDDGSEKEDAIYLDKYNNNPKIRVIHQENKGVAKTRNKAIGLANGKYIMFIDNDDYVDNKYIETLYSEIKQTDLDVVISGYRRETLDNKVVSKVKLKNYEWSKFMVMAPWAKIYKKEYIRRNGLEFLDNNIGEDIYFNLIAMTKTKRIKILDYAGYVWYYNEKSVSNTKQKTITNLNYLNLLEKTYSKLKDEKILEDENTKEIVEYFFLRYIIWLLLYSVKNVDKKEIKKHREIINNFMEEKFKNYKNNSYISVFKPKGEKLGNRIVVWIYMLFKRWNLEQNLLENYSNWKS